MQSLPKFTVQLFAAAREIAGVDSICVTALPESRYISVAELREEIVRQYPQLGNLLRVSAIAINHEIAPDTQRLIPFDEVAVIPPVSGG